MSVKVIAQVWERSRSKGNDRLVLLAIADVANDDGTDAWPSLETIAFKIGGVDERTVRRCIRNLEDLGELRVELNAGGKPEWRSDRRPNLYTVLLAHKPKRERGRKRHARDEGTTCPPANDIAVVPQVTTPGQSGPPVEGTTCPPVDNARGDTGGRHGGTSVTERGDTGVRLSVLDPTSDPSTSPNPHEVGAQGRRVDGANPRATTTSPRDEGTNPRALDVDAFLGHTTAATSTPRAPQRGHVDELPRERGGRSSEDEPQPIGALLQQMRDHLEGDQS